jgi:hypothetical protein
MPKQSCSPGCAERLLGCGYCCGPALVMDSTHGSKNPGPPWSLQPQGCLCISIGNKRNCHCPNPHCLIWEAKLGDRYPTYLAQPYLSTNIRSTNTHTAPTIPHQPTPATYSLNCLHPPCSLLHARPPVLAAQGTLDTWAPSGAMSLGLLWGGAIGPSRLWRT